MCFPPYSQEKPPLSPDPFQFKSLPGPPRFKNTHTSSEPLLIHSPWTSGKTQLRIRVHIALWCLVLLPVHFQLPPSPFHTLASYQPHATFCFPKCPALHHHWAFARALSTSWFIMPLPCLLANFYFFVRPQFRCHFSKPAPIPSWDSNSELAYTPTATCHLPSTFNSS